MRLKMAQTWLQASHTRPGPRDSNQDTNDEERKEKKKNTIEK
jgi:hypothetical protein